jgi:tetratricopeptide (TPR) repeat protein
MLDQLQPAETATSQSLRPSLYGLMGEVLVLVGRYDEALEHYASARALFEERSLSLAETRQLADLCRQTAEVYERQGQYDSALQWVEQGLGYLQEYDPSIETARLYRLGGWLHERRSDPDQAIAWGEKSITIASQQETRDGKQTLAYTYNNVGVTYWGLGRYDQAAGYFRESLDVLRESDILAQQIDPYLNLGGVLSVQGNWLEARQYADQARHIANEIGDVRREAAASDNLGLLDVMRGECARAMDYFEQSMSIWRQLDARFDQANTWSNIAHARICQRNWAEARQALIRSQALFAEIGSDAVMLEVERHWAVIHWQAGELAQALDHIERSVALAVDLGDLIEEGVSRRVLGQVYQAQGKLDLAEREYHRSLQILDELKGAYFVAQTQLALARLLLESGREHEGTSCLTVALEEFERMGAKRDLAEARKLAQTWDDSPSQV